jgi:hypothetical protein
MYTTTQRIIIWMDILYPLIPLSLQYTRYEFRLSVLLVTGAGHVGKTTFLQHIRQSDRGYVTLDDPLVLDLARRDPALFMQRFPPPVEGTLPTYLARRFPGDCLK